jgi:selT/selW/selH-like putative selenoprotein
VDGARGAFEVFKDGALVFSKLQRSRFPASDQEVIDLLKG